MPNNIEIIRCNHCGKDHRSDYCIATGKVPSDDCPECDTDLTDFADGTRTIIHFNTFGTKIERKF